MSQPPVVTQEMIRLYDEYTHLTLDRRGFMDQLARLTGSAAAATVILPLIAANAAKAAIVAVDDPRLASEKTRFPGASGPVSGYLVHPAGPGRWPTVIVAHENRGLNPHIEDVARRIALEGFLVLAVDFLSPAGGTPPDEEKARALFGGLDPEVTLANAGAAIAFLKAHPMGTGKVGAVGFCWGGGLINQMAIASPDLAAGVAYYGVAPDPARVPAIKAKMLLHYAGLDDRVNAGVPAYEEALKAAGIAYTIYRYEGVNHAFNNDTAAARYNKEASDLAFGRTIAMLKEALG